MPGYDRTGPMGQGPMTGRQMGYCAQGTEQTSIPQQPDKGVVYGIGRGGIPRRGGRGRGFGGGRGRGLRRGFTLMPLENPIPGSKLIQLIGKVGELVEKIKK